MTTSAILGGVATLTGPQTTGAAAALVVCGVLGWVGVAKLRAPAATASSFRDMGLPYPLVMARAVPAIELFVAVSCIVRPRPGAAAAASLLALFTALLSFHLRRGSAISCGCFGSADRALITWVTLVRNAALVLTATVAMAVAPVRPTGIRSTDALAVSVAGLSAATFGALVLGLFSLKQAAGAVFSQAPSGTASAAMSPARIQPA